MVYPKSSPPKRPYRSPRRKAQAEGTRAAIVEAAGALFVRDGYAATSMKEIAHEAGVAEPTVYAALADKASIARAVADAMVEHNKAHALSPLGASITSKRSLRSRARAAAQANVGAFTSDSVQLRDALSVGAASDPRLTQIVDELTLTGRELAGRLVDLVAGPKKMKAAARTRATDIVWAVSSSSVYRRLVEACEWTEAEYVDWLAIEIERAVRGARRRT